MRKSTMTHEMILRLFVGTAFALLPCTISFGQPPQVRVEEVREFEILISGKPAGSSRTRITEKEDGVTTVCTDAEVKLNYVLYTYRYEFHGRELWNGNRLVSVDDRAIDGGKELAVNARVDAQGSVIQANKSGQVAGPVFSMTTSYWHSPEGQKGSGLSVLDADQGTVHAARIESVTADRLVIGGKQIECMHYELSSGLDANLWFDPQHRLVRQQTIEEGRPVELRLVRIDKKAAPFVRP